MVITYRLAGPACLDAVPLFDVAGPFDPVHPHQHTYTLLRSTTQLDAGDVDEDDRHAAEFAVGGAHVVR